MVRDTIKISEVGAADGIVAASYPVTKDKYMYQWFAAFSVTLLLFVAGTASGWASPSIPKLLHEESSPIPPITDDDSSWIISVMELGVLLSAVPSAWLMDRFGRKIALAVGVVPITAAWIIFGTAEGIAPLFVARIFCGLTYGLCYTVVPMYLGEIASDNIRGAVTILLTVMMKSGILFVYVVGTFVSFRTIAWINLGPAICFICMIYWLPETPYYLIDRCKLAEARQNLIRLRGHSEVDTEFTMMEDAVNKSKENTGTFRELFHNRGNRRALFVILILSSIQILCGSQSIVAYAETIFNNIESGLDASYISMIFGVVQLVAAAFSASVVDCIGRRPLLLVSVIGTLTCNFIVGLYFYLETTEIDVKEVAWVPILAIMVFVICYVMGMATVIFALLGEIFPTHLKAIAGAVYTITSSALSFGVHKLFQVVNDEFGSHVPFWAFAVFGVVSLPFIWFMVPETKGKSLDDILKDLNSPKKGADTKKQHKV